MPNELTVRAAAPDPEFDVIDALGEVSAPFLAALVRTTQDCVKLLSLDGRITYANPAALEELMGGTLDQVRDTVWSSYWPASARPLLEEAIDRALDGNLVSTEVARPTGDSRDRYWQLDLTPLFDWNGEVRALLVMSRDLTANANEPPGRATGR